jgi:hypothetical protein
MWDTIDFDRSDVVANINKAPRQPPGFSTGSFCIKEGGGGVLMGMTRVYCGSGIKHLDDSERRGGVWFRGQGPKIQYALEESMTHIFSIPYSIVHPP